LFLIYFSVVLRRESFHVPVSSPPPLGEHAHKTPLYDTKMLPKVVCDEIEFVKFKISDNLKQNIE
jgi:hypothetical protein